MKLPFVSRSLFDGIVRANDALGEAVRAMASERDWLRAQLEGALDHNRRIERIEHKVHEVPVQPKKQRDPMPREVRELIDAWEGEETRARLEAEAYRRYDRDGSWDNVRAQLEAG